MAQCKQCGSCCRHLPGFFEPGREDLLEDVAGYLKISLEGLKKDYLIKDYRAPFGKQVWFWSPRMVGREGRPLLCALEEYPQKAEELGQEGGHCIFFSPLDGHCLIHPVKPLSCRLYDCQEGKTSATWIYFHYFGGESSCAEGKIRINQGDWAACWDFYCPKCGDDEAEYTDVAEKTDDGMDHYEVVCQNCGYQFWVY